MICESKYGKFPPQYSMAYFLKRFARKHIRRILPWDTGGCFLVNVKEKEGFFAASPIILFCLY